MITWDEVKILLRVVLRWWWLVVLATGVAAGTAFYISKDEARYYVARTTLMIGNTLSSAVPDQNQISLASNLARFYGELARREPILLPVQTALQLPFPWQIISDRMLSTNVVPSANLLEIYVTDTDPERAATIANVIGEQLTIYSPNSPDKIQAEKAAVEQQLKDSDTRINQIKGKISDLMNRQQQMTSANDLAEVNDSLAELNHNLTQEQSAYTSLLSYKNNSVINSLSFFERASPPGDPLPSKRKIIVAGAGLAGLLLSLAAIFVIERLSGSWRVPRDIEEQFNLDDLGSIPIGPPLLMAPEMFIAERLQAARDVQTNILLADAEQNTRILMLTSPQPSESRTSLAIDLADLFGRAGQRVLIVDADFTSSLLTRMLSQNGTAQNWTVAGGNEYQDLWAHLRPTPMANVALLPGRGLTNGEQAMIPSLRWRELVERLLGTADMIIFDGPATLSGPDAALLAPHVDGVVLTLDPTIDNREDVEKSKTRLLRHKGARLLGAVTFTPSKQRTRFGKPLHQIHSAPLPILPSVNATESNDSAPANAFVPQERAPIITPPPNMNISARTSALEAIVLMPAIEAMAAPTEAAEVVPDGLIAAQVGGELAGEAPAELAGNAPAASVVKKPRRSRGAPKPTPLAEAPKPKLHQR